MGIFTIFHYELILNTTPIPGKVDNILNSWRRKIHKNLEILGTDSFPIFSFTNLLVIWKRLGDMWPKENEFNNEMVVILQGLR